MHSSKIAKEKIPVTQLLFENLSLKITKAFFVTQPRFMPCSLCLALELRNIRIEPERPKVLVGDTLVLNCSAETTYNGIIEFEWQFHKSRVSY